MIFMGMWNDDNDDEVKKIYGAAFFSDWVSDDTEIGTDKLTFMSWNRDPVSFTEHCPKIYVYGQETCRA